VKNYLTPEEAAKILGYHLKHVYRLLAQGRIRAEMFRDHYYMIPVEEVDRIKKMREAQGGKIRW